MKYALALVFSTFIFTSMYGQSRIEFQPGYFVDNSGDTTQALIKNQYWIYNPEKIEYKLNDSSAVYIKTRQEIKEFFVSDLKYVSKLVLIDKSEDGLKNLTVQRSPDFKEERLFLKVMVEGDASLYKYGDRYITRFFLETEEQGVEQLVYRQYKPEGDNLVRENNLFKQQLSIYLKCSFEPETYADIEYDEQELKDYFIEYNECIEADYMIFDTNKKSNISTTVSFKTGYRYGEVYSEFSNGTSVKQNISGFEAGLEFEFTYFGKPWSFIVNPNFNILNRANDDIDDTRSIKYEFSEFNLGVYYRNYFFIKDKKKFFAHVGVELGIPVNWEVETERDDYEYSQPKIQPKLGVGYFIKDQIKVGLEGAINAVVYNESLIDVTPGFVPRRNRIVRATYHYYSFNVQFQF